MLKFTMTEKQAEMIHSIVSDRIAAIHNWIATAVETDNFDKAKELTKELREYRDLFASFNMRARRDIAAHTGKPMETEITVR